MNDFFEDPEALKAWVELMKGLYEDDVIEHCEAGLAETPDHMLVPMPNTAHPALSQFTRFIQEQVLAGKAGYHINVMKFRKQLHMVEPREMDPETMLPTTNILLTRKKFWGPAPFIGDPLIERAAYFWNAWIDDLGRWIAMDAELRYDPYIGPIRRR